MISIGDLTFVGIDPGTTAAVAVLDIDGDLVDYRSEKEFGKDRMIRFIVENGKPLAVATDVAPVPSRVDAVASNMGVERVVPDMDLASSYKDDLVAGYPADAMDSHARDALAAAEYARRTYSDTVDRARRQAREAGVPEQADDVIELVVKGGMSVSQALGEIAKAGDEAEEPEEHDRSGPRRDWESIAAKRQDRIDLLESKVANLEEALETGDEDDGPSIEEDELRARNREIRELRDRIAELEAHIERLQDDRDRWREAFDRLRDGWRVVPTASAANGSVDTVVVEDGPVPTGVDTVIGDDVPGEARHEAVVVPMDEVDSLELDGRYLVDPDTVNTGTDAEAFMAWLEDYRSR